MIRHRHSGTLAVLLALSCALLASAALSEVLVSSPKDLEKDEKVQYAQGRYRAFASAVVIYDQCASDYPVIAVDRDFVKTEFAAAEEAYRKAYHDGYVRLVGYQPDAATVQDYVDRMRRVQQRVVNTTALSIQSRGCHQQSIEKIIDFVTKTRRPPANNREEDY